MPRGKWLASLFQSSTRAESPVFFRLWTKGAISVSTATAEPNTDLEDKVEAVAEEATAWRMKLGVDVRDIGPCKKHVRVKVPEADIKYIRNFVLDTMKGSASVPGFRPGKAPKEIVAKKFAREIFVVGGSPGGAFEKLLAQGLADQAHVQRAIVLRPSEIAAHRHRLAVDRGHVFVGLAKGVAQDRGPRDHQPAIAPGPRRMDAAELPVEGQAVPPHRNAVLSVVPRRPDRIVALWGHRGIFE